MSSNYQRIMVPVDGSESAKRALEQGIELARIYGAKLYIVHVIDVNYMHYTTGFEADFHHQIRTNSEELLKPYVEEAQAAGLTDVEALIKEGLPKYIIAETLVDELQINLIVIGSTGYSPLEKFFIGSTTEYVNRNTKADVLVVR